MSCLGRAHTKYDVGLGINAHRGEEQSLAKVAIEDSIRARRRELKRCPRFRGVRFRLNCKCERMIAQWRRVNGQMHLPLHIWKPLPLVRKSTLSVARYANVSVFVLYRRMIVYRPLCIVHIGSIINHGHREMMGRLVRKLVQPGSTIWSWNPG
jgi:hypothetical protein